MIRRLEKAALKLYPAGFRARYECELRALLDDAPPRASRLPNLLVGAAREHVSPDAKTANAFSAPCRAIIGLRGVLIAWLAFVIAGLGFYKTTENDGAQAAVRHSDILPAAHLTVQLLAVAAGLAIGAALILFLRAQRHLRTGEEVPRRELRLATTAGMFGACAMLAMAIATIVYSVFQSIQAPALADALDGPLQANSASISIDIQFVAMLCCAIPALVAARRARRAAALS